MDHLRLLSQFLAPSELSARSYGGLARVGCLAIECLTGHEALKHRQRLHWTVLSTLRNRARNTQ